MEPIAPLRKRPKPSNDVDATADRNRFNDLPEELVHHIFSFLETIDVIRASAVSTNWRYLWTSMPHLKFSYRYFRLNPSYRGLNFSTVYEKFKDFISWILMAYDKSVNIQSFRLVCWTNRLDRSLYRWVNILSQKHVQELYLTACTCEELFALQCCLPASNSLEVLELDLLQRVLKIPSTAGFSRLKSLRLVDTQLLNRNLFQNFISSCPLLENLRLDGCLFRGFKALDISSNCLRKLIINNDGKEFQEGLIKCDLKIACPNLVYFDLTGHLMKSFSCENSSFLQTAIIFAYWDNDAVLDDESCVLNDEFANFVLNILRLVCHVEVLKLRITILQYISPAAAKADEPGCFSITFNNLKSLKLSTGMGECYIQSIIYLLKCSPNLQLLSIFIDQDWRDREYEWEILDEDIACLTCHLKRVKLIDIDSIDEELQLIGFFLTNGHVLEKMSIIWLYTVNQEEQREAIQKVMKFPRFSSLVNVTFSEPLQGGYHEFNRSYL